jgi:hypothetical protein
MVTLFSLHSWIYSFNRQNSTVSTIVGLDCSQYSGWYCLWLGAAHTYSQELLKTSTPEFQLEVGRVSLLMKFLTEPHWQNSWFLLLSVCSCLQVSVVFGVFFSDPLLRLIRSPVQYVSTFMEGLSGFLALWKKVWRSPAPDLPLYPSTIHVSKTDSPWIPHHQKPRRVSQMAKIAATVLLPIVLVQLTARR